MPYELLEKQIKALPLTAQLEVEHCGLFDFFVLQ